MTTWAVKKTIYVLVGLPFAGKTTAAREFVNTGALIIERDRFLEEVGQNPNLVEALKEEARGISHPISRVFETVFENAYNDALTREYVRRVTETIRASNAGTIVVDGTHLSLPSRSFVTSFPEAQKIAMVIFADPETCIQRFLTEKSLGVRSSLTPQKIRRMHTFFQPPTTLEGFDEVRRKSS